MDSLTGTSVVVVGAGFGGLSTACYLADAGADVTVLEKNDQLGGRASLLDADGFEFDMGPSWYLMPDAFERFFAQFDREPTDYYDLERLDPHYRVFFKGEARSASGNASGETASTEGSDDRPADSVDMTGDLAHVRDVFESFEDGAGDAFERYLEQSKRNYEVGMERFVYQDRTSLRDYLSLDVLRSARGLTLLGSMEDHVADYFDNPRLRQLVQYSLVFLGGSPSNTPALYSLMSHVDFNLGVHYPRSQGDGPNGVKAVADGIADLARELGVEFVTGAAVTAIDPQPTLGGAATGAAVATDGSADTRLVVRTADREWRADAVVSDADYAHTEQELLAPADRQYDEEYWESRTLAPSAFLLYLGVEGDVEPLAHHTLVLPDDWNRHFDTIFEEPSWPEDPAYYVCAPSVTDDSVAPDGHSNLFVLVPVASGLDDGPEIRATYRDRVLADLAEHAGVDVRDRIVFEETFSVSEFAERYNSLRGTALGLAHTLRQTSLFRPPHRSDAVEGLYFVGANTTPGIGVPMCLISGEHAAGCVAENLGGG
jgi:phytoene desaturase